MAVPKQKPSQSRSLRRRSVNNRITAIHPIACGQSYEENYNNGPRFSGSPLENLDRLPESKHSFLGFSVDNPLGIPAGPLLNAQWVKSYLDVGFAVPVYKTVRSIFRVCHPAPNYTYIAMPEGQAEFEPLQVLPTILSRDAPEDMHQISIGNSFGVPCMGPEIWMPDVELANSHCRKGQLLIVSVMGTEDSEGRDLRRDFAYTAAMAHDAGAKVIEANFSCPNLLPSSSNNVAGTLYADAERAGSIAKEIRQSIGKSTPLLLKIGYLSHEPLKALLEATRPYVDGYAGINSIGANVRQPNGDPALPDRLNIGISGTAIRRVAQQFVRELESLRHERKDDFVIVGVGGMMETHDLTERLQDGADLAMSATASMRDPYLALRWLSHL